ncbi:DUF211 domain-containing protein [Candidatus Hecatella orcuttiae]|jgi:hypothetical protein|uniref:DUF211 domain-containing protein n=1 Tax=Candidatus Hecatella orcuttiae TaxID=1935119 RepID=UPI0028683865|nr:DUF211 domain-containing protein [Candidatus Hecatella orcuttiae]
MVNIRRLVIDSLMPRDSSIIDLSQAICRVEGVEEVDISVMEVDVKTETIKLTIRGANINYDELCKVMNDHGTAIRSIDEINVARKKISTPSQPT